MGTTPARAAAASPPPQAHTPLFPVARVGVAAPPASRRAAVWDRPVPGAGRAPLVWLLGAHGGAGATTLAHVLAPAGECGRHWPGVLGGETPYVVLVARETIAGLSHAHDLLRQHHAGLAGPSQILGLITVAARPGRLPAEIRRYRDITSSLATAQWRIGWHEEWTLTDPGNLPTWAPGDSPEHSRRAGVPTDMHQLGTDLVTAVRQALHSDPVRDSPPPVPVPVLPQIPDPERQVRHQ